MKSSNFALRLPESLKKRVEQLSTDDGTTINQFIVTAVAQKVSALTTADFFKERASRANLKEFDRFMSRRGGEPPQPGDEIWNDGVMHYKSGTKLSRESIIIEFPEVELEIREPRVVAEFKEECTAAAAKREKPQIKLKRLRQVMKTPWVASLVFTRKGLQFGPSTGTKHYRLQPRGGLLSREQLLEWLAEELQVEIE